MAVPRKSRTRSVGPRTSPDGDVRRVAGLVSVVIPALNAEATIESCVRALLRQTLPCDRYEILVVDDGSRDRTAIVAERAGARVVRLPRTGGPGGARNAGIRAAGGEVIVFTDADCEPTPGFLEALVAPLADPAVGGSKGAYLSRQSALVGRFVQIEYEDRYRREAASQWLDLAETYAVCYRRPDLERVGGFDARIRYVEDQELSFRLSQAGVRILFVPEARTYHQHAARLGSYLRKKYQIARWKVAVLRRHPGKAVRDSHTPQALKFEMLAACGTCVGAITGPLLRWTGVGASTAWLPVLIGLALFLIMSLPFTMRAFARDRTVGLVAPVILFMRDLALVSGLAAGSLRAPSPPPEVLVGSQLGPSKPA